MSGFALLGSMTTIDWMAVKDASPASGSSGRPLEVKGLQFLVT